MNYKKVLGIALFALMLAGCGSKYKVCPLKYVKRSKADFVQKKDDVEVRVKQLTQKKVGKYASGQRNASWFVPLLVTIKNTSERNVCLEDQYIDLKLVSAEEISKHLSKKKALPIVLGVVAFPVFAVGSVFFGVGLATFLGAGGCAVLSVLGSTFLIGTGVGIPVIVGTTALSVSDVNLFNNKLSKDLKRKVVSQYSIAPQKKESALLFVRKKDLPESFDLTLLKGEEKVPFTISLKK